MNKVIWICALVGIIPGLIAKNKGHSLLLWWVFGAVLFVVALPAALIMKPNPVRIAQALFPHIGRKVPIPATLIMASTTPPAWHPAH